MVWAHVTMWQSQKGFPCLIHSETEVRQQYLLGLQGLRIHVTCQQHTVTPDMDMKDSVDKLYTIHYTPHAGGGAGVHDWAGCYICRLPEQTGAALRATMARTGTWHLTPVVTTVQPWHNHTQLTQLSRDSQDNNRSASTFFSPTLNTPDTARNRTTLNGSSCECLNLIVPLSGNSYTFYN